jgi:hypothetical protein
MKFHMGSRRGRNPLLKNDCKPRNDLSEMTVGPKTLYKSLLSSMTVNRVIDTVIESSNSTSVRVTIQQPFCKDSCTISSKRRSAETTGKNFTAFVREAIWSDCCLELYTGGRANDQLCCSEEGTASRDCSKKTEHCEIDVRKFLQKKWIQGSHLELLKELTMKLPNVKSRMSTSSSNCGVFA